MSSSSTTSSLRRSAMRRSMTVCGRATSEDQAAKQEESGCELHGPAEEARRPGSEDAGMDAEALAGGGQGAERVDAPQGKGEQAPAQAQKLGPEERHSWQPVRMGRLTPFFRSDLALLLLFLFAIVAEQFHLAALHLFEVVVLALTQTLQKTGQSSWLTLDVPVVRGGRQRPAASFRRPVAGRTAFAVFPSGRGLCGTGRCRARSGIRPRPRAGA